jgi:hypothetical protein
VAELDRPESAHFFNRLCLGQLSYQGNVWWLSTRKLEPILARSAEAQPRRLAGASTRCAPPEKTVPCIIFEIPPAVFFLFS